MRAHHPLPCNPSCKWEGLVYLIIHSQGSQQNKNNKRRRPIQNLAQHTPSFCSVWRWAESATVWFTHTRSGAHTHVRASSRFCSSTHESRLVLQVLSGEQQIVWHRGETRSSSFSLLCPPGVRYQMRNLANNRQVAGRVIHGAAVTQTLADFSSQETLSCHYRVTIETVKSSMETSRATFHLRLSFHTSARLCRYPRLDFSDTAAPPCASQPIKRS